MSGSASGVACPSGERRRPEARGRVVTVCEAPPRPAAPACGPAREPGQVATIAAGAARPACRAGVPCQDPFTDADPVREHVRSLMSSRIGWTQVARLAGVPLPTVSYLLYGSPIRGFPPSRRIRTSTADRLLAVTPGSPRAGGALADGTGTRRRLQALVVAGWSERALAETAGLTPEHLRVIVRGRRMVTAATARRVSRPVRQAVGPASAAVHPGPAHDCGQIPRARRPPWMGARHGLGRRPDR